MTVQELGSKMGVVELRKWILFFDDKGNDGGDLKDLSPEEIAEAFGAML